eukprot:365799-Chlamydomonas_euryale.AAC.4
MLSTANRRGQAAGWASRAFAKEGRTLSKGLVRGFPLAPCGGSEEKHCTCACVLGLPWRHAPAPSLPPDPPQSAHMTTSNSNLCSAFLKMSMRFAPSERARLNTEMPHQSVHTCASDPLSPLVGTVAMLCGSRNTCKSALACTLSACPMKRRPDSWPTGMKPVTKWTIQNMRLDGAGLNGQASTMAATAKDY